MSDEPLERLQFHHGGVSVPDLDAAISWYQRVLGFVLERQFYIETAKARVAMVRNGALRLEIFEVEGAAMLPVERRSPTADLKTHGNKHVAFEIDDLDAFIERMNAKSADIALVVRESFGESCFIRDCAGNLIEFVVERH